MADPYLVLGFGILAILVGIVIYVLNRESYCGGVRGPNG